MAINRNFLQNFLSRKDNEEIPDIPDMLEDLLTDIRGVLPPKVFTLIDAIEINGSKNLKDLKCQLEREKEAGQRVQCARGYRELVLDGGSKASISIT